jgi:hypothetical protein
MHEGISSNSIGLTLGLRLRTKQSGDWVDYFQQNGQSLSPVPWEAGAELSEEERNAIAKSVQAFQLGESSEGHHLQTSAETWARYNSDLDYAEAIRLFIKEEQRHASELGRFLELNGVSLIQKTWTDTIFRRVRRLAGLELSIMVLLTAEIVAQVYYFALGEATQSSILRGICEQILRDEDAHVRFQCERLAIMGRSQGWMRLTMRFCMQRAFMLAAIPIVWVSNRPAYLAGGFSFDRFASETWLAFNRAVPLMHPRSYV